METTPSLDNSASVNFLSNYFYNLSLTRMNKHCANGFTFTGSNFAVHNTCEVLGDDTSITLLWGEAGAVVLKVHYDFDVIKHYAAASLAKSVNDLTRDTIRGYMNEYLNLYSGYFRGIAEDKSLIFGGSLPFHTRGKDELIFFKLRDQRFKFFKWKIKDQNGKSFFCSFEVYPIDDKMILGIQHDLLKDLESDKSKEIDGEIQFF